jgi:hypothetical protein
MVGTPLSVEHTEQRDRVRYGLHRDLLFFGRSWRRGAVCFGGFRIGGILVQSETPLFCTQFRGYTPSYSRFLLFLVGTGLEGMSEVSQ